ncbi:DUF397 domain-containing protein [Streptomyces coelicoflavus]|uniref:DUF397 domain-containing protein n=1 Tax=Streptomyces coelicoflavus TaxID=285562 RepID=UPI003665FB78
MIAANPEPLWFKSSYSGGSGTECVECAYVAGGAMVRDSKRAGGPEVRVQDEAWRTFVRAVNQGRIR